MNLPARTTVRWSARYVYNDKDLIFPKNRENALVSILAVFRILLSAECVVVCSEGIFPLHNSAAFGNAQIKLVLPSLARQFSTSNGKSPPLT